MSRSGPIVLCWSAGQVLLLVSGAEGALCGCAQAGQAIKVLKKRSDSEAVQALSPKKATVLSPPHLSVCCVQDEGNMGRSTSFWTNRLEVDVGVQDF